MSLFQTKLVLSGIGDPRTLEAISLALGEYDRDMLLTLGRSETDRVARDPHTPSRSATRPSASGMLDAGGDREAAGRAGAAAAGRRVGVDRGDEVV